MLNLLILLVVVSFDVSAFRPQNSSELFLKPEEKEKAMACNQRYLNFKTNFELLRQLDYEKVCSCEDMDPVTAKKIEHHQIINLQYLSKLHVSCQQNLWMCLNITEIHYLESAKTADDYCALVEEEIQKKMEKNPFMSNSLLSTMTSLRPIFNRPKFEWPKAACAPILASATLHPRCKAGGGGVPGSQRINSREAVSEKSNEGLD